MYSKLSNLVNFRYDAHAINGEPRVEKGKQVPMIVYLNAWIFSIDQICSSERMALTTLFPISLFTLLSYRTISLHEDLL